MSPAPNYGGHFAVDKLMQNKMRFFFVKTTADVRHHLSAPRISPQTCDKNKISFLEVNLDEKKCLKSIGNSCVFSILVKSFKKYDFGMRVFSGRFSAAALLYIISTIRLRKALRVMP